MEIAEIKKEMLNFKDFWGGELLNSEDIEGATTKEELKQIINKHHGFLEAELADAQSHLRHFTKKIGLEMIK